MPETDDDDAVKPGGLVMLDSVIHRRLRMQPMTDYSVTSGMHCAFIAASEFPHAAIEFPIVFIHDQAPDADGKPVRSPALSPVVMLGITVGENLVVDGPRWDAGYLPAVIRRYPFATMPVEGSDAPGVFIDTTWAGISFSDSESEGEGEGEALFDDAGKPTEMLGNSIAFLRAFEAELHKTRAFCAQISRLDLARAMKADASLPNGETLSIDGFMTIDEARLQALPDAAVIELHRSGMMPLLQAHLLSLANLRKLVDRKARRMALAVA